MLSQEKDVVLLIRLELKSHCCPCQDLLKFLIWNSVIGTDFAKWHFKMSKEKAYTQSHKNLQL